MEFTMAKSHHDVGVAFGKLQAATGSRMSTINISPVSLHNDDMATHTNKTFYPLQYGISYRTVVARIMRNSHTKRNELWITPRRYSSSTERHKGYLRTGFYKANPMGFESDDVFYTSCVDDNTQRNNPLYVNDALRRINQDLPDVDKPRLREATRRGTLTSCLHRADVAMRNFTRGIPLDVIDADTYYDLQAMIGFLTTTLAIENIDEVRAAVRGHLALTETEVSQ
jgi:hypothetical protein